MRIFVLNTGRCGSVTFAKDCSHIENYSVGHESKADEIGPTRCQFPDQHIEVDNRLSWFLGQLEEEAGREACYVHLTRDVEAVASSFARRWRYAWRGGIIEAFAHATVMHGDDWPEDDRIEVCRYYVNTVTQNIEAFLRDKPNRLDVRLEHAAGDFQAFWKHIEARGDLEAALAEWEVRHNASDG